MTNFRIEGDDGGRSREVGSGDTGDGHDLDIRHPVMFRVVHVVATHNVETVNGNAWGCWARRPSASNKKLFCSIINRDALRQRLQDMIRERVFENGETLLPVDAADRFGGAL